MVRVLICDDQTVVREGLAAILSTDPEIEVVGLAGNGQEALDLVPEARPDVVLMDLKMPVMNGVQATQQLRQAHPQVFVLVLTTYAADEWVFDAIRAGRFRLSVEGYPARRTARRHQGHGAGRVLPGPGRRRQGHAPGHDQPSRRACARDAGRSFTERELEILGLIARGHSNPEIAQRLHLARGTVRNYVSAILDKLGVSDRTQAAVEALRRGLVNPGES